METEIGGFEQVRISDGSLLHHRLAMDLYHLLLIIMASFRIPCRHSRQLLTTISIKEACITRDFARDPVFLSSDACPRPLPPTVDFYNGRVLSLHLNGKRNTSGELNIT